MPTRRPTTRPGRRFAGKFKPPVYPFTITSVSPSSNPTQGTNLVVNLVTVGVPPTATVYIDGVAVATTVNSAISVTCTVLAASLAHPGTLSIQIRDVTGNSNTRGLLVTALAPTLTSSSPARYDLSFPATTRTFTLTGTNFYPSTDWTGVLLNGVDVVYTWVSATSITVNVADGTPQTLNFQVYNLAPGGGTSATQTSSINYPLPTVTSVSPSFVPIDNGDTSITVTGTGVRPASVITIDGVDLPTTYIDSTHASATVPATVTSVTGTKVIRMRNPTTSGGGGTSVTSTNFMVGYAVPTLTSISPSKLAVNAGATTITLNGSDMSAASVARVNGTDQTTNTAGQPNSVSFSYTPSILGEYNIDVTNPLVGPSMSQTLAIVPGITSISPNTGIQYDPPTVSATVSDTGGTFVSGCVVEINGIECPTTFVNATTLTITIPGTVSISPGALTVRVKRATGAPTSIASVSYTVASYDPLVTATGNYASYDADHVTLDSAPDTNDVYKLTDIVGGVGPYENAQHGAANPTYVPSDSSLNGYAAIDFNGINEVIAGQAAVGHQSPLTSVLFPAGDWTVAVVFLARTCTTDAPATPYTNAQVTSSDSNPGSAAGIGLRKNGGTGLPGSTGVVELWMNDGVSFKVTNAPITFGNWHYAIFRKVGSNIAASINGGAFNAGTTVAGNVVASTQRTRIGKGRDADNKFMDGRFRAIIYGKWVANDFARFAAYCQFRLGIV